MRDDLKDRFALADDVRAPDLWAEARRRATASASGAGPGAGPARHRLVTAAVAFAVFAGAVLFAWSIVGPGTEGRDVRPRPAEPAPVDLSAALPVGWSELPAPPEVRTDAARVWTGSHLLVWGGFEFIGYGEGPLSGGGFSFDAASRTWESIPRGPLAARADPAFAWTGRELLLWGGWHGRSREPPFFGDGAAYDPVTNEWRSLPAPPIEAKAPLSVWTGEEMIVWGTSVRFPSARMDGAAYDPASNAWRSIAEAPIRLTDATAVWTGEEMIVFGAALDGNNWADTDSAVGAAYDPTTDTWRRLPPSELSPQAHTAAWPSSGEMVAWDYEQGSAAYDPVTDAWRSLGRVPLRFVECSPESVAIEGFVFGNFCGQLALYSASTDDWAEITQQRWRGWVLSPVAAESAFLVMGHSVDVSEVSDEEFERTLLAFVPPEDPPGTSDMTRFIPSADVRGAETRMPVVFPDGSRATLRFPTSLGLESLGVQPDVSYVWKDDPAPRYPIVFLHDPNASIARFVDQQGPTRLIDTSRGGIEVWRASGNDVQRRFWLRYELPSWTVLVSVRDALDSAVEVHRALRFVQTEHGFPVVEGSAPLALAEGFGEAEGPHLAIGDSAAEPDVISQLDATVFLSPDGCQPGSDVRGTYGSSCLADGSVFASIYGDRAFVRDVVEGLRVEAFRPGPPGVT